MYDDKTIDELKELLTERDALIATMNADAAKWDAEKLETNAEKESYKNELAALKETHEKTLEELKSTKELNFTLGRQVAGSQEKKEVETLLHDMFGKKER